ncbi:hypothetical protein FACS189444_4980 [Spirochaetia bacterium]|nr:hypothetical protein FACS189444_4980 [Spirochaetia bacterium]
MALLPGYKPVGAAECSPVTQSIDGLLMAAGFTVEERGKEAHCGWDNDIEIVQARYIKNNGERVFLITHLPETTCGGCIFTRTCDHKVVPA